MTERENFLRAATFQNPEWIPVTFHINPASFLTYDQNFLFDQMEQHKLLFPHFVRPKGKYEPVLTDICKKGAYYYDGFGCRWESSMDGILGTVVEHPLADISKLETYQFPDPKTHNGLQAIDWDKEANTIKGLKEKGCLTEGGLRHGHTFLQMCDIRGYDNFLFDMMDEEPYLKPFMEKLTAFNIEVIKKYVAMGVDVLKIPEDLGMQVGPMLSVDNFNEYVLPCYRKLIAEAKKGGSLVHMHSDGDIRKLVDGLITDGVDIINLQDLVNGIDWIEQNIKGRVAIELDIDRQNIVNFGTPTQIDELIKTEIKQLDSKNGGLMMIFGLYPYVPEKNIVALMDALEKYMIR
ncbi:MAG: hypothetical protein IKB20_00115 [Clostridia bacterium]|nr:hypothetical protein [Clostridia bacterium]